MGDLSQEKDEVLFYINKYNPGLGSNWFISGQYSGLWDKDMQQNKNRTLKLFDVIEHLQELLLGEAFRKNLELVKKIFK